ncbi:MAG: hypothetical protein ACREIS_12850, partial [Nitrospiraceae bacterium]
LAARPRAKRAKRELARRRRSQREPQLDRRPTALVDETTTRPGSPNTFLAKLTIHRRRVKRRTPSYLRRGGVMLLPFLKEVVKVVLAVRGVITAGPTA